MKAWAELPDHICPDAPLCYAFNQAVLEIAHKLMPEGWDVSADAPETYEELQDHYRFTKRVLVSNQNSGSTIYASAEVNHAFRAWHDYHHIHAHYDLSLKGEYKTAKAQQSNLILAPSPARSWFMSIIWAEVYGQTEHFEEFGAFPVDQFAFVWDYLFLGQGGPADNLEKQY